MRAALVQATWTGDAESMIAKHEKYAREAATQGAKVMVLDDVNVAEKGITGHEGVAAYHEH